MDSGAIARFGGITAYGDTFHGEGWHLVGLDGWTDAPDVSMERLKRPGADGTFALPAYFDERVVQMSGFMVTSDRLTLENESVRIRRLAKQRVRVDVEDPFRTLWTTGTFTVATFTVHPFAAEGTWKAEVTCPDPRVYGETHDYPVGVPAFNVGNTDAHPILEVTGPHPAYTISTNNGHSMTIGQALTAGQKHLIDMRTGRITLNGILQVGAITSGGTWVIAPGMPGVVHSITGTASLTVHVTDTYI